MATFIGAQVVGGELKLRKTASTSGTVLIKIPNGTALTVTDYNDIWVSTSYSGKSGYVKRQFVDVSRSSNRTKAEVFSNNTLKRGHSNRYVCHLQHYLNRYGANLTCDGIFGSLTESAVISYQTNHSLAADGEVGSYTKSSLLTTPQ